MMLSAEVYARWRYRLVPDHIVGEILSKNWIDNAIPVGFLVIAVAVFSIALPAFLTSATILDIMRQLGEVTFVVLGETIVMLGGGIDLSIGSNFALANFVSLGLIADLGWPLYLAIPCVLLISSLIGLINGVLVGYMRLRAFLTTLAMLIVIRAGVDTLLLDYGREIAISSNDPDAWDFLGAGFVLGIPINYAGALVVAVIVHIFLSRMRVGWHILAVGGSRRSAYNAGIPVRRTVCLTYVLSGLLTGVGGMLYAARLSNAGAETGVGLEVTVLTAAVLGGVSLGGGRGSVAKAVLGMIVVLLITNCLLRLQLPSGSNPFVLGLILLLAVAVDVRWLKNRQKVLSRVYVSPTYFRMPECPPTEAGSKSPYAVNNRLREAEAIGLDVVDGAEDMAFDQDDNLYTGSRHGDIIRFFAGDYSRHETFVHIGGHPLALHFDGDGTLYTCVAGMGLYKVTPQREVIKLSDETNRSWFSVLDDSRMRLADDMDFAPDGRVFFSEATIRYDMTDWPTDALEMRGNGRIICYDPRNNSSRTVLPRLSFPNGICMTGDGESFLFAETWACRISRYWFDGPKKGRVEPVIPDMPGYTDNIRRASDGTFWIAVLGMRAPAMDLALRMPGFRRRMAMRVAFEEWMYPNINTGCIVRFRLDGTVIESYWDEGGEKHPMITSMREHKGFLYIGGIYNNRIGRLKLPWAEPTFNDRDLYWAAKS